MSRIGRLPITVPSGIEVSLEGREIRIKGSKGELSRTLAEGITVEVEDGTITVHRPNDERESRSLHGLTRSLINNMIIGVTEGFTKKLEIVGTGYRVQAKGNDLEFALGYSHPVPVKAQVGSLRDRQAAGRRGRCEYPQTAQARPVQGQRRALRRRADSPQGRKGR